MAEDGQIALNLMAVQLRMAGFWVPTSMSLSIDRPADPMLVGCRNGFSNPAAAWTALGCVGGAAVDGRDSIAVRFDATEGGVADRSGLPRQRRHRARRLGRRPLLRAAGNCHAHRQSGPLLQGRRQRAGADADGQRRRPQPALRRRRGHSPRRNHQPPVRPAGLRRRDGDLHDGRRAHVRLPGCRRRSPPTPGARSAASGSAS